MGNPILYYNYLKKNIKNYGYPKNTVEKQIQFSVKILDLNFFLPCTENNEIFQTFLGGMKTICLHL
jgi:hypothetical protein